MSALAQKITVKKIKGLTALIETTTPLEEGQTYDLQVSSISTDVNYSAQGFKSRQHSLTFGINFSTFSAENLQNTVFNFQARYGWNFSVLEFGLLTQVSYLDEGAGAKTDFAAGGYFDYNLITNRDSRTFIYGPFGLISIGSTQKKGGSANLIDVNAGGFISFFPSNGSTAFRLEAFADQQQISSATASTNLLGFGGRGLIILYF